MFRILADAAPLLMLPQAVAQLSRSVARLEALPVASDEGDEALRKYASLFQKQRPAMSIDPRSGVAIIHISGPLALGLAPVDKAFHGMTDYEDVEREIAAAIEQDATAILFVTDSPGGTVQGAHELAAAVADVSLPTAVASRGYVCSAAYEVAAGADHIAASFSSTIGSVGAFVPWVDQSAYWAALGLKWEPVISEGSDFKAMAAGPSLEPHHRQFIKEQLTEALEHFVAHIDAHRGVDPAALKGQSLYGYAAKAAGLVDSVSNDPVQTALSYLLEKTGR